MRRDWLLAAGCFAAASTLACQALAPTISERRLEQVAPDPSDVITSLEEEFPDIFPPTPVEADPPDHIAAASDDYVPPQIGDEELLQVEFREANLSQVVHFIAERAGINIVLDPFIDREVDVSFPSVTADSALQAVLGSNGLRLVESTPGIYAVEVHDGSQPASASFTVQSIDAVEIEQNLKDLVSPATQVVVNGPQNLVVVIGPRGDVDAVATYLAMADRLKRQVLIEVRIIEVSLNETFELGLTAALNDGTIDGDIVNIVQDLSTPDAGFSLMYQSESGEVDATIQAISQLTGIDLVSSPRVLAMTGTEAKIEVLQEVPYINVTQTTTSDPGTGTGSNVIEEVQFKESGITLTVTPTILERGTVHCLVTTVFSEVVGTFNDIPIIDTRELVSDFLVKDRETVVLGGLMQNKKTEIDKGIPGLMDLPLVGRLFRSDEDDVSKRELIVFFTPRIVDGEEAARLEHAFKSSYVERVRQSGVRSQHSTSAPEAPAETE